LNHTFCSILDQKLWVSMGVNPNKHSSLNLPIQQFKIWTSEALYIYSITQQVLFKVLVYAVQSGWLCVESSIRI